MSVKDILQSFNQNLGKNEFLAKLDRFDNMFESRERVSLDIGNYSVKVVQLKSGAKEVSLVKAGYKEIPRYTDDKVSQSKALETEVELISETVNQLLQEEKIKTRNVRLVISDPALYLRHITIPKVADEELSKAIKWQAEKYTPFPIEEALVDFQIVKSNASKDQSQMEVIIVAVERAVIDKYLDILKPLRIIPSVIDVAPFAAVKSLWKNYPVDQEEIVPIVDIGMRTTSVIVVGSDALHLVRNIDLAGDNFTQAIVEHLNVNKAEAEKIKRESVITPPQHDIPGGESNIFRAIEPLLNELNGQIERSLAYCEREFLNEKIKKIVLCGGGSKFSGLDQYFANKLGLPVETANSFKNVEVDKKLTDQAKLEEMAARFMPVFGEVL